MEWIAAILVAFFIGTFVHIQKRLDIIIKKLDELESILAQEKY